MSPTGGPDGLESTMVYWLAQTAKQARLEAKLKPVEIAGRMAKDQSTVYRFEAGDYWPKELDLFVAAYAEMTGMSPWKLWERALQRFRDEGTTPTVAELRARGSHKQRR